MGRILFAWQLAAVLPVAVLLGSCGQRGREKDREPSREKVATHRLEPGEVVGEIKALCVDGGRGAVYAGGSGRAEGDGGMAWRVARWRVGDGGTGWVFDADGVIWSDPGEGDDRMLCIAMDGEGALYGGGFDTVGGNCRWRVEKWDALTGERVRSFGQDGALATNASPGDDYISAMAFVGGGEGALILAGCDSPGVAEGDRLGSGREDRSNDDAWRIEKRRASDGRLVAEFGDGGIIRVDPSPFNDEINAIVLDAGRGHFFLAGWDRVCGRSDRQWRIEKRRLDTGAPVESFGAAGVIQENPSALNDVPAAMVGDPSSGHLFLSGWDNSAGSKRWRIEKRRMSDGGLVEGFGRGGVLAFDPSDDNDVPKAMALDAAEGVLFIGGVTRPPEGEHWRIEKRRTGDGTLVTEFGNGGVIQTNPSSGNDEIRAMAVDRGSGLLWAAGFQKCGREFCWCVRAFRASDGAPVVGPAR